MSNATSSRGRSAKWPMSLALDSSWLPFASVMVVMVGVVSPVADFPLNDDWVYAEIVRELVEQGTFYEHPYRGALVVTLTLWGALFASAFGASYTVLRCSTLVLALVAVSVTTAGARAHGVSRPLALLSGAVVLANPVFLNLAYTFMSDVPFLAFMSCAGFFYLHALSRRSVSSAFWGSVFVAVATATKQIGIVLIVAFLLTEAISWLHGRERPERRMLAAFTLPLVVGAVLYVAVFGLPSGANAYFWPEASRKPSLVESLPVLLYHASAALTYMGLFTLPIALVKIVELARGRTLYSRLRWVAVFAIGVALQLAAVTVQGGEVSVRGMPMLPNVLYDLGSGPITLRDVYVLGYPRPEGIGNWWWLIHLMALSSTALLIVDVLPGVARHVLARPTVQRESDAEGRRGSGKLFLVLWVAAITLFPYHLLTESLYDRYLLPALFPVSILAVGSLQRIELRRLSAAWLAVALLFVFSLAAVQDYFAWNTARWEAANYLRFERGVGEKEIDGGFEYNGTYLSAEYRRRHGVTSFWKQGPGRFWLLDETKYAIYENYVEGCRLLADFPYRSLLGFETRRVFAMHCEDGWSPSQ